MKSLFDAISVAQARWVVLATVAVSVLSILFYGRSGAPVPEESSVHLQPTPAALVAPRKPSGLASADSFTGSSRSSSDQPGERRDATLHPDSSAEQQALDQASDSAVGDPTADSDEYGRQMGALVQQQQLRADLDEQTALAQTWGLHIDLLLGPDLPPATKEQLLAIQAEGLGERDELDQWLAEGRISADEYRGRLADVMRRQGETYAAVLSHDQYIKLMNAAPEEDVSDLLWPPSGDESAPPSEGPLLSEDDPANVPPYEKDAR